MENRPMSREKRVVAGGSGLRRSGSGLGKEISERNVLRKDAEEMEETLQEQETEENSLVRRQFRNQ